MLSALVAIVNPSVRLRLSVCLIFAGVRLGRGVKRHWGLSTTAIFGDLGGYVFENFRYTASNIIYDDMLSLVGRQMIAK